MCAAVQLYSPTLLLLSEIMRGKYRKTISGWEAPVLEPLAALEELSDMFRRYVRRRVGLVGYQSEVWESKKADPPVCLFLQ
jgi:hypothetical protein